MEKPTIDYTDIEKLADACVNILTDSTHQRQILKKVYLAAYEAGQTTGHHATINEIIKYLGV